MNYKIETNRKNKITNARASRQRRRGSVSMRPSTVRHDALRIPV